MNSTNLAPRVTTRQYTTSGTPQSIDPERAKSTYAVQLAADGAGTYVGGPDVSTSNGAQIPVAATGGYLKIQGINPGDLYIVGSGKVFVVYEEVIGHGQ